GLVEADFADPTASGLDEAAVPAGEAAHRMVGKLLDELSLADPRVQRLGEGGRPAVRGGGGFMSEERDDAALRHGIRRLPPFLNIAGPAGSAADPKRAGREVVEERGRADVAGGEVTDPGLGVQDVAWVRRGGEGDHAADARPGEHGDGGAGRRCASG